MASFPIGQDKCEAYITKLRLRIAGLEKALRNARRPPSNPGKTHWEGCWMDHLECARETIKRLTAERDQRILEVNHLNKLLEVQD